LTALATRRITWRTNPEDLMGERAKLDELRRTDKFERFSMDLNVLFNGYGVIPGVTLEGMKKVAERNPDLLK
jgi:hypothetical protein